jgi:hypothetical protein
MKVERLLAFNYQVSSLTWVQSIIVISLGYLVDDPPIPVLQTSLIIERKMTLRPKKNFNADPVLL